MVPHGVRAFPSKPSRRRPAGVANSGGAPMNHRQRARALVVALLMACGSPPPPRAPISNSGGAPGGEHEPLASIERTACFGWCPIYRLTAYRDGSVVYEGEEYVKTKGHATGRVSPEQLTALDDLFQKAGYLALRDQYTEYRVTDMPSVNTSYSAGGKTKAVKHYLGDSSAPRALTEVEDGIDRIVHVEQWIGTEKEREDLSQRRSP